MIDTAILDLLKTKLGSKERMTYDASRKVLEHNAVREKVCYARVARGSACRWCRLMAIRGAVFVSPATAIKGSRLVSLRGGAGSAPV